MLISDSRFDLVWFRLSCDHGWIRSGSVNVRKQQQQQDTQPCNAAISRSPAVSRNRPDIRGVENMAATADVAETVEVAEIAEAATMAEMENSGGGGR